MYFKFSWENETTYMSFLVGAATITLELVVTAQRLGVAEVPQAACDGCVLKNKVKFTKSTGGVSLKKRVIDL